jgi:3-oxoadipate enol-lactonase
MANVNTDVGRLYVADEGDGPPVLFWPSFLSDGTLFSHQRAELARDHRVLTVDPPGHGRSETPRGDYTLEECAQAALQVLDAFGFEKAVLVGLSWGGMTALRVALRAPSRVRALALLDSSAEAESWKEKPRYYVMLEAFKRWGAVGPLVPRILEKMFCQETLERKPRFVAEFVSRIHGFDREGVVRAAHAVILGRRSILSELGRISVPALVAVGDEDSATPPFLSRRMAGALANARFETIPGAGHLSALEQPFTVNRLLRELLARI